MIVFKCPGCKTEYSVKDEFAGKKTKCRKPGCGTVILVPILTAQPATPIAVAVAAPAPTPEKPRQEPSPPTSGVSTARKSARIVAPPAQEPTPRPSATPTQRRIYIMQNGQQAGPFPLNQIQQWVGSGQLHPDDLVWVEETPAWVAAREVALLFPKVAVMPAPRVEEIPMVVPVDHLAPASRQGGESKHYKHRHLKEDIPLIFDAVYDGNLPVVRCLLDSDPKLIHLKIEGLGTPLHTAAWSGLSKMAEFLVRRGAAVKERDLSGKTPLHSLGDHGDIGGVSGYDGSLSVAEVLLFHGADVNARDDEGSTPLHHASDLTPAIVELLLRHGANPKARDKDGRMPIHRAAFNAEFAFSADMVDLLLSKGADASAPDNEGSTPIHEAILGVRDQESLRTAKRIIKTLLLAGADINAQGPHGMTPLMWAIDSVYCARRDGNTDVVSAAQELVSFLQEYGATEKGTVQSGSEGQNPKATILLSDFSFTRHFRLIQWGATLQYNLMRAAFAGLVVGIVMAFLPERPLPLAACLTAFLWWPIAYLIYLLPILFIRVVARVSLQSSPDSSSGLAMFGCLMAWFFIILAVFLVAVGDPLVCLLKAIFPRAVPVETPPVVSLQPIIFVLDASEVTITRNP